MKQDLVFVDGFGLKKLRNEKHWSRPETVRGGPEGKETFCSAKVLENIEKSNPDHPTQHERRIIEDLADSLGVSADTFILHADAAPFRSALSQEGLDGVISASAGTGRIEAFQGIRDRAKKRIIIVGIGMSHLTSYAEKTLARQARSVPIEFLMLDPVFLEKNRAFAKVLQKFLGIRDFANVAKASYNFLKTFVRKHNKSTKHKHTLRVYSTIPTMSMVMIDPDTPRGEVVIEFFLHKSGEYRPRFHIENTRRPNDLFSHFRNEYDRLCEDARTVV